MPIILVPIVLERERSVPIILEREKSVPIILGSVPIPGSEGAG